MSMATDGDASEMHGGDGKDHPVQPDLEGLGGTAIHMGACGGNARSMSGKGGVDSVCSRLSKQASEFSFPHSRDGEPDGELLAERAR